MSVTEVQATDIEGALTAIQAMKALSLRMNQMYIWEDGLWTFKTLEF